MLDFYKIVQSAKRFQVFLSAKRVVSYSFKILKLDKFKRNASQELSKSGQIEKRSMLRHSSKSWARVWWIYRISFSFSKFGVGVCTSFRRCYFLFVILLVGSINQTFWNKRMNSKWIVWAWNKRIYIILCSLDQTHPIVRPPKQRR